MQNLSDASVVKDLLARHGFKFSKALGQNFLINPTVCPRMAEVCGADENTGVIEVGPGFGVLTAELAKKAKKVVSVELDERLLPVLDETLAESIIYVPDGVFEFAVPFGYERKSCYAREAFAGDSHRITCAEIDEPEIYGERLISLNSHDRHNIAKYYPHAVANFVTREDPCFFERNAIDGVIENTGHGPYPYHSWGGGLREDFEYEVHFGTEVEVSRVTIFLRADFPHDT